MLFMGEEWAASSPFPFFTSHPEPELGRAVSEGRVREFAKMAWDVSTIPDPQDPETYRSAKLDWSEPDSGRHATILEVYRTLASLRRRLPELTDPDMRRTRCTVEGSAFVMRRGDVVVVANFGDSAATVDLGSVPLDLLWSTPTPVELRGGTVVLPPHAGAVLAPLPG